MLDPAELDGSPIPAFTPAQLAVVIGLLKAERQHASRWWTFLNELRLHRQLPEWAAKQAVGRHVDYDSWHADCCTTNRELLRIDGHLNRFDENQLIDDSVGTFARFEKDLSAPQIDEVPFRGAQAEGGQ